MSRVLARQSIKPLPSRWISLRKNFTKNALRVKEWIRNSHATVHVSSMPAASHCNQADSCSCFKHQQQTWHWRGLGRSLYWLSTDLCTVSGGNSQFNGRIMGVLIETTSSNSPP